MSQDWYNGIARKNGGYKSDARYILEGPSGEEAFEKMLADLLPNYDNVLDIGCGHGEFTLKMSKYCKSLVGADNAKELLGIAQKLKLENNIEHVSFVQAHTKGEMPFEDESFDMIYSRRGPTSIVNYSQLLKPRGILVGIHTFDLDKEDFIKRLETNGFVNIKFKTFDQAYYYYDSMEEFAKHKSAMHCSLDYTLKENEPALLALVEENKRGHRIAWPQHRYVWQAEKGHK